MAIVTFRIPDQWTGKVDSRSARRWLVAYLKHPVLLPPDPGAGKVRISISLPNHLMKIVKTAKEDSPSGSLRRIIAANLDVGKLAGPRLASGGSAVWRKSSGENTSETKLSSPISTHLTAIGNSESATRPRALDPNISFEQICWLHGLKSSGSPATLGQSKNAPSNQEPGGPKEVDKALSLKKARSLTLLIVIGLLVWLTWAVLKGKSGTVTVPKPVA